MNVVLGVLRFAFLAFLVGFIVHLVASMRRDLR